METKVIRITDPETSAEELKEAAHILREGGLVVFPTETVYGLGGNGLSQESAEKLVYACCGYNPGMSVCFFSMAMALIRSSRFSSCSR